MCPSMQLGQRLLVAWPFSDVEDELLTILTHRLGNDPETERRVMLAELAKINRLRLKRLPADPMPEQS